MRPRHCKAGIFPDDAPRHRIMKMMRFDTSTPWPPLPALDRHG
jgi:hypothetical protein